MFEVSESPGTPRRQAQPAPNPRPQAPVERSTPVSGDTWLAESAVVETTLMLPTTLFRALEADARRRKMTAGRVIRELIRCHLTSSAAGGDLRPPLLPTPTLATRAEGQPCS